MAICTENCSPTCHCTHPIHNMSDNVRLVLKNIALKIITAGAFTAKVTISRDN